MANAGPDLNTNTIVTSGYCPSGNGCYDSTEFPLGCSWDGNTVQTNYYATTARSPDGTLIVSYLPSPRTITVDLRKMSTPSFVARWFNPASGQYTTIGTFSNTVSNQSFTPPPATPEQKSNCSDRDQSQCADWVLVLR